MLGLVNQIAIKMLPNRVWCVCVLFVFGFGVDPVNAQAIVAHRGASHDAPENTLAAFKLAWRNGADAIEGDFYLSSDGQVICIHDKDTERTAPGQRKCLVAKTLADELRRLDVGSWKNPRFKRERIPTLAEVLATVPSGKKILIEIKCGPEIVPALKTVLDESDLDTSQIIVISFSQEVVAAARRSLPGCKANWLTSYQFGEDGSVSPSLNQVIQRLRDSGATGLGTKGDRRVVDSGFVNAVRNAGFEFHVWTVNEPRDAEYFRQLGVDSITTDRPKLIREELGLKHRSQSPEAALSSP
ncbi:MAG: glycerophosphodiester phosphodiesterase [Aureliella sp.]